MARTPQINPFHRTRNISEISLNNYDSNDFSRKKPRVISDILSSDDEDEEEEDDAVDKIQKSRKLVASPAHASATTRLLGLSLDGCDQEEEGESPKEEGDASPVSLNTAQSVNTHSFVSFGTLAAQAPHTFYQSKKIGSSFIGTQDPFKGIHSPWVDPQSHIHNKSYIQGGRKQQYGVSGRSQFKSPVMTLPALRLDNDKAKEAEYYRRKENLAYLGSSPVRNKSWQIGSIASLLLESKNSLLMFMRLAFMMIGVVISVTFIWSKMTYIPGFQATISSVPRMFSHAHHAHHTHETSEPKSESMLLDKEDGTTSVDDSTSMVTTEFFSTTCETCDKFISTAYEVNIPLLLFIDRFLYKPHFFSLVVFGPYFSRKQVIVTRRDDQIGEPIRV